TVRPRDDRKEKTFTVSYLVESLGKGNPGSVLSLLKSYVLTSELTEIVSKVPKILGIKKEKAFCVYYDFIKEIVEADNSKFKKLSHSLPQGSKQENKLRNILALRELGMPQKLLFSMLISYHHACCGKDRFEESLKKIVDMGFDPTIEEKVNVYKRLGFDVEDVWAMFKKWPNILSYSEQKILNSVETFLGLGFSRDESALIVKRFPQLLGLSAETVKKKTEFLVKKMNWPLEVVVANPQVIAYNFEKRTAPRCNVVKTLMSKGFLGSELPPLSSVLSITDEAFLKKDVKKYDDKKLVPELMAIFTSGLVS
ncbi:hypothetical protein EUTSA_v10023911mg, partial [Eutrema salsugineum]